MPCNCGKRRVATQPKKIVKTPPRKPDGNGSNNTSTNVIRRIIRRAAR